MHQRGPKGDPDAGPTPPAPSSAYKIYVCTGCGRRERAARLPVGCNTNGCHGRFELEKAATPKPTKKKRVAA